MHIHWWGKETPRTIWWSYWPLMQGTTVYERHCRCGEVRRPMDWGRYWR